MSGEKLPDTFDVVICGTGLIESMVGAALSRIDKKVLHVDRNDYYGSQWATFNFATLNEFIEKTQKTNFLGLEASQTDFDIPKSDSDICNIVLNSYLPEHNIEQDEPDNEEKGTHKLDAGTSIESEKLEEESNQSAATSEKNSPTDNESSNNTIAVEQTKTAEGSGHTKAHSVVKTPSPSIVSQAKIQQGSPDISLEDLNILSRKFNLDLSAKFLFSAGPLVQAIIKANISHYMEFKLVDRILTINDDHIIEVPCNRSDVFTSNFLTMIEKRMLMKFLTFCLEDVDFEDEQIRPYITKPFEEFLQSRRLTENLKKFIIYSIAMVKPETVTELAIQKTQSFIQSLGKYGKSPFLWPLFGIGEIPQAFCRMCAVFGGLYCLRKEIKCVKLVGVDSNKCSEVVMDDQSVKCNFVVCNTNYVASRFKVKESLTYVSRAILITMRSIAPSSEEHISFLTIPPLDSQHEIVRVIEVGPASSACPTGLFVVYLTCLSTDSAKEDLEDYVFKLVTTDKSDTSKPHLLWSVYFNQLSNVKHNNLPENLFVTSTPGVSLGFADAVKEAEEIFRVISPEGEFMLTVPNPEDIKWDYQEEVEEESSGKSTDGKETSNDNDTSLGDKTSEDC